MQKTVTRRQTTKEALLREIAALRDDLASIDAALAKWETGQFRPAVVQPRVVIVRPNRRASRWHY